MTSPANILLIDTDARHCQQIVRLVAGRHQTAVVSDARQAVYYATACDVDLVFLSADSSQFKAEAVCQALRRIVRCEATPVILTTAGNNGSELLQATGADDLLLKPVQPDELENQLRIYLKMGATLKQLETANSALKIQQQSMQQLREQQSRMLAATQDLTIFAMAKIADSRDPETGEHLHRMRDYAVILAAQLQHAGPYMREIDDGFIRDLHRAAPLHDIGKVGIRDGILLKPGKLTAEEFETMKLHTLIGAETLEQTIRRSPDGDFLKMAVPIARHHHEWFDGSGYPDGLRGREIPLAARIVAVADVFDALTSKRCYKKAFPVEEARRIICEEAGTHFDPAVVEAFTRCYDQFIRRQRQTVSAVADAPGYSGLSQSAVAKPAMHGAAGQWKAPAAMLPAH